MTTWSRQQGASNMQCEFNSLKALILKENSYAFYIHCFVHQLQLVIIAVAKNNVCVDLFFTLVNSVVNIVGAYCTRKDIFQDIQAKNIAKALESGELERGQGLNQETNVK